jgi:hypothetical protein
MRTAHGGTWVPKGPRVVIGHRPNPVEWRSWGKPSKAVLFVGLTAGRATKYFPKGRKFPPRFIYGAVFATRVDQVGTKYGSSFVRQEGHYIPRYAKKPGEEPRRREKSLQIVLYPAQQESWSLFRRHVKSLANVLARDFGQETIIAEFVKDGVVEEVGEYGWKR